MQTPKRKQGKYAHLKPDTNITEAKYNELKQGLERMKKKRPLAAAEVKRLAEMGDFSENAEYQIAKGRLRGLNQRILDTEDHLKRANIIKTPDNTDTVQLGHRVVVEINGKQKEYLILGSSETNPLENIISHNSPIGSALMGRGAGDKVKVRLKNKEVEYRIIKIKLFASRTRATNE